MKKTLLLLILLPFFGFSQKAMVGFTSTEIRERNRLEFETKDSDWETIKSDDYWCLHLENKDYELMTFYFFFWGEKTNFLCSHVTHSSLTAEAFMENYKKTHIRLGEGKFLTPDKTLLIDYKYNTENGTHSFNYYDPKTKNPFKK
jgi:hypothetical protein